MPDPRSLARLYGASRVVLGVGFALFPRFGRMWMGKAADDADVHSSLRVLGVRDALLGVAVLGSPDDTRYRRGALLLCAVADTADAVVTLGDVARTRRIGAALASVTAAGGAVIGLWTRSRTDA